jgi:hypothetical protein
VGWAKENDTHEKEKKERIRMAPVRGARYNIRRKSENAPAKSTTARAKK